MRSKILFTVVSGIQGSVPNILPIPSFKVEENTFEEAHRIV